MKINQNPKQTAFTVIELMIVVAVIITVSALLFPALYRNYKDAPCARPGLRPTGSVITNTALTPVHPK